MGKRFGYAALACLASAAIYPLLFNKVLPVYLLYALALTFSIVAGFKGSRRWFLLSGVLTLILIVFVVFVAMVWQGSRVGG
jgi:hypothetical protein